MIGPLLRAGPELFLSGLRVARLTLAIAISLQSVVWAIAWGQTPGACNYFRTFYLGIGFFLSSLSSLLSH